MFLSSTSSYWFDWCSAIYSSSDASDVRGGITYENKDSLSKRENLASIALSKFSACTGPKTILGRLFYPIRLVCSEIEQAR